MPLAWMLVGLVGLAIGWVALILAPGQSFRYHALGEQASSLERITDRGAWRDAWIVFKTLSYVGFAVPWLALGVIARRKVGAPAVSRGRRVAVAAGLAAAVIAALTLLGSPKEGERLAFASCALAATAIGGWVTAQLAPGWSRRACVALAAVALVLSLGESMSTLHAVSGEARDRWDAILATPRDATLVVHLYTVPRGRSFLGDEYDKAPNRQYVADTFGIGRIDLPPDAGTLAP